MTRSEYIERMAAIAYSHGADPLALCGALIAVLAENEFSLDWGDPRAVVLARRIMGALLDCGWTMPATEDTR
jgi:hypothetical protein